MKYIDEFRDGKLAQGFAARIRREVNAGRSYALMEFCGGHTHAIFRYGIEDLLPPNVRLIHGPGCPVCVLPSGRLQAVIELSKREQVILCSYGDLLRVPGAQGDTLLQAKARGVDVRMVYSVNDALDIARAHPDQAVVFFAIGFETTTPPTAVAILQAKAESCPYPAGAAGDYGDALFFCIAGTPDSTGRLHRSSARQHHYRQ